jgi:hypothetical protein
MEAKELELLLHCETGRNHVTPHCAAVDQSSIFKSAITHLGPA